MDMPTVCDCGEVVEFNSMLPFGNRLYCEDCHNELEDESDE